MDWHDAKRNWTPETKVIAKHVKVVAVGIFHKNGSVGVHRPYCE
jgi:hypothetical protein